MGKLFTPYPITSGFNTNNSLNTNFSNIETALEDCLSKNGYGSNAMTADLDMNNNAIFNVGDLSVDTLEVGGLPIPKLDQLQQVYQDTLDVLSDTEIVRGQAEDARDASIAAQGFSELAQGLAETAQGLAEAAQAAAEDAVASINLPTLAPGDAGKFLTVNGAEDGYDLTVTSAMLPAITSGDADKVLSVKGDETGYELSTLPPIPTEKIPLNGTVNVSVTSGGTYPTVKAAIDYGRATYIPGTGNFNISINKTSLGNDDVILAYNGENLSWMSVYLTQASYTYTGTTTYLINGAPGASLPQIFVSAPSVSISKGRLLLAKGSFLNISGGAGSTLNLDGLSDAAVSCVYINGGELAVTGGASISATGVAVPLKVVDNGRAFFRNTLTLNTTNALGLALVLEDGGNIHATTTNITVSNFGPAVTVDTGASAYLRALTVTGITGPTSVSATGAGTINLRSSSETCNLADNTVSTNGILIR